MEHNCTATISAVLNENNSVTVDVCYTHYGHEKELHHLRMPKGKRQEIAARLQEGVKAKRILDDVRESVHHEFHRHHLADRRDLANIERSFGLRHVQRHNNDQQSALAWVEEWRQLGEDNPVSFVRLQGEEAPDGYDVSTQDFIIVVQSPLQRHMLQQFGGRGVCCDAIHGTNAYNFTLTTLLVIDEFGQGFPVGWCLANHEDFSTMCIFFRELQSSSGSIASGFVMSDMAVEAEIYKMLRTVLEQTDESLFQDCLSGLLDQLSQDARGQAFRAYFVKDCVTRKEHWAYCYRKGMGINTNMFVEAFPRVFKRVYLGGRVNKRVNHCLVHLMRTSALSGSSSSPRARPLTGQRTSKIATFEVGS